MSTKVTFASNLISTHVHCFAEVHSSTWSSGGMVALLTGMFLIMHTGAKITTHLYSLE